MRTRGYSSLSSDNLGRAGAHPDFSAADDASIRGLARQYAVPISLARVAWEQGDRNYRVAYEYLRLRILARAGGAE